MRQSIDFLLRHQDADGAWRDFRTKPGRSDAWVTAYIGLKLCRQEGMKSALDQAARFVLSARRREGWAYNENCDPDADSTAHAILFLTSMGCQLHPSAYAALAKFQRPCGGFATYGHVPPDHGWGRGHPDVTAAALRALSIQLAPEHDILHRGRQSLAGATQCYWWSSHFYLPLQLLLLGRDVPQHAHPQPTHCYDQALALEYAVRKGEPAERVQGLAEALRSRCLPDGSWPSAPILRITNPRSRASGDELFLASPIVADDRKLFTTATAVAALSAHRSPGSRNKVLPVRRAWFRAILKDLDLSHVPGIHVNDR